MTLAGGLCGRAWLGSTFGSSPETMKVRSLVPRGLAVPGDCAPLMTLPSHMCTPTLDVVSMPLSIDLNLPEDRVGPRPRRRSKRVWVGGTAIGDGAPVSVQSMCTTLTHDVDPTIRQIERLQ